MNVPARPFLRIIAATIGVAVALVFCAANTAPATGAVPPPNALLRQLLVGQALSAALFAPPVAFWCLAEGWTRLRERWFAWPKGWGARRVLGLFALALAGSYALAEGVTVGDEQEAVGLLATLRPGQLLLFAPFLCVLTPLAEECLFRGVLQSAARPAWALPISAICFGLAHGANAFALPLTLLGWVLGWVTQASRSLLPAIVIHGLFNLLTLLALF